MRQIFKQQRSVATACGRECRVSIYDEVTARIIAEMEQGRLPWVKPWDAGGAGLGLPRSAATRKPYSGINILILWDAAMARGYAAQEWMTLRQCNELGGHIRKGEHGTAACYADSFIPKAERERATQEGNDPNRVPFLKRFILFNIEQCEGLPAHIVPPPAPHPTGDLWAQADRFAAAAGATICEGGCEAYYNSTSDFIRMPPAASFISAEDYGATLYHELGHWTAHPSRLNRDLRNRYGSTAYAREELIAELTSAFLCAGFGIVPKVRHADYLANWLAVLKGDSRAIFHAASQASKASDFLLNCRVRDEGRAA
jgi:antirestriction protein ArdC